MGSSQGRGIHKKKPSQGRKVHIKGSLRGGGSCLGKGGLSGKRGVYIGEKGPQKGVLTGV